MKDAELIDLYKDFAPNVCIAGDDNACADCNHVELDTEVDSCGLHTDMYHDWDMSEEINFVYRLTCSDFS